MLTSEEVPLALKESVEILPTINRKPTDNDITPIVETLAPILMEIKYDLVENTYNLWGVITADGTYTSEYRVSFDIPPKLAITNKTIAIDATEATIQGVVVEHAAQKTTAPYTMPPTNAALPS